MRISIFLATGIMSFFATIFMSHILREDTWTYEYNLLLNVIIFIGMWIIVNQFFMGEKNDVLK